MGVEDRLSQVSQATQSKPAGIPSTQPFFDVPRGRNVGLREVLLSVSQAFSRVLNNFVVVERLVEKAKNPSILHNAVEVSPEARSVNFNGTGVTTVTDDGNGNVTVTIAGGGGGSGVPSPVTGIGSPVGSVSGSFGQMYRDTTNGVNYVCISNPSGNNWETM